MPSTKSKEDTWKTSELEKSLRDTKDDRRRKKDPGKDERKRDRHRDEETGHRRRKDEDGRGERKYRDRENGEEIRKEQKKSSRTGADENGSRRKHKDQEDRHGRTNDDNERENRRRKKDDDDTRERRHRRKDEDDGGGEKRHRRRDDDDDEKRHRRKDEDDRERRHRRKDEDDDREKRHRRRDDDDGGGEKRHRRRDDDDDEKRHRRRDEDDRERRHKRKDDDDGEKRHRRRDEDDRERRHRRKDEDDDREKRHRKRDEDDEGHRKHREQDDEEEARRRRHEERKERKRREKAEEERRLQEEKEAARRKKEAEEEADQYDYEDDFEDYEDDFEDEDDDDDDNDDDDEECQIASSRQQMKFNRLTNEVDSVLKAMDAENDRLLKSAKSDSRTDKTEHKVPSAPRHTFINFVSAKQRQMSSFAAGTARRRGLELQHLIELDVSAFDMFDLPPVNEYELYIRSFGGSNTKQAYIQTNDDNVDRELQTEEVMYTERWTQQPALDTPTSGGGDDSTLTDTDSQPVDIGQLNMFVHKSAQVICTLLEENFADNLQSAPSGSKHSTICISEAFTELHMPQLLQGRHVTQSCFSPSRTSTLLTLFSPSSQKAGPLSSGGVACVWNVNDPAQPTKILVCDSQPRCGCFSPVKASLVFVGNADGSLVMWDLSEVDSLHRSVSVDGEDYVLRSPSYDTAGVLHYDNHTSPVVSIQPVVSVLNSSSETRNSSTDTDSLSFQLATLEENSLINLWVVGEVHRSDLAGSQSDLGLSPGARIQLVKSSTIQLHNPLRETRLRSSMHSFTLQLLPSNNSHYYVATNTGCVVHGVRYGGRAPPRAYYTTTECVVDVTCIDFTPFSEDVFLAGFSDGSLCLYHTDSDRPLLHWASSMEDGAAVAAVFWCRSRPSVFFALDSRSILYIWDLAMSESGPLKHEPISQDRVTSLCLSNDHSATGVGISGRRPQMVVAMDNGTVEVHTISKQFSAIMDDERGNFSQFLKRLI